MSDFDTLWEQAEKQADEFKKDRPMSFYGQLAVEGRPIVFAKGFPGGKRDFDPDTDPEEAMRMAIKISVLPVSERATRDFEREFVMQSREGDMFRESLAALGVSKAQLQASPYVRVDLVPDARLGTYSDRTTGAERTRAGVVLREVFPDADACKAAADARYAGGAGANGGGFSGMVAGMATPPPPPTATAAAGAPAAPSQAQMDRKTAAKFFPGIWSKATNDPAKFLAILADHKLMRQHFSPPEQAPEVLEFLTKMGHPEYEQKAAGASGDNEINLPEVPF